MVRPNHDLPAILVGAIKDYANEQDVSSEQAHEELLRDALIQHDIRIDESA